MILLSQSYLNEADILVVHNGIARLVKSYFQDFGNEEFAAFGIKNAEVCEFEF